MILLSASKVWLWVQRDGGIWSFLTWTKSHLSLHRHPETSLEVVEETLLILQESQYCSLLELDAAVSRWMFSGLDLLQGFWFVHLRLENEFFTSHWRQHFLRIESFCVDSDASIFSNSSTSAISTSPFQILPAYRVYPRNNPGKTFFPNWWILDWSFAVKGWYSTNEPNGIIGPLNGCPKRLSWGVFPSDNKSVTFRR